MVKLEFVGEAFDLALDGACEAGRRAVERLIRSAPWPVRVRADGMVVLSSIRPDGAIGFEARVSCAVVRADARALAVLVSSDGSVFVAATAGAFVRYGAGRSGEARAEILRLLGGDA